MMNLNREIFALLESLGVEYSIQEGIVYATTPDGEKWDFTIPLPSDFRSNVAPKRNANHEVKS